MVTAPWTGWPCGSVPWIRKVSEKEPLVEVLAGCPAEVGVGSSYCPTHAAFLAGAIKVVVASGGNAKSGTVYIYVQGR